METRSQGSKEGMRGKNNSPNYNGQGVGGDNGVFVGEMGEELWGTVMG